MCNYQLTISLNKPSGSCINLCQKKKIKELLVMRSIEEVAVYEETIDKTGVGLIRPFQIFFQADSLLCVSHMQ